MHVVSFCLHYGNIIWLPWQRSLENKVQIHHLHIKPFHTVKRFRKSVLYIRRYLTKSQNHNAFPSVSLFSAETTGPIFTKILHDIVALVALLNLAYTRCYPIPFLNARATKLRSLPFFSQNWLPWQCPWGIGKRGPDRSSAPKRFYSVTAKIGPCEWYRSYSGTGPEVS